MIFVTSNHNKFSEAEQKLGLKLVHRAYKYPELQTDEIEDVVRFGIEFLRQEHGAVLTEPFFIEDSGLFIDALDGFPGVYSKYVFVTIGCNGILRLLENVQPRSATFKTVIGYHDDELRLFIGECPGEIAAATRGEHGFGYDPIFVPQGSERTFAEMETAVKNSYSHRARALARLHGYLLAENE